MTDSRFAGSGAVVTGASRGLGAAIATLLAEEGMAVCLVAREEKALAEVAGAIRSRGGTAYICAADLTRMEDVARLTSTCTTCLPSVDALINCAGATKRGDFFALNEDDWRSGFDLKLFGAVRMSRALWSALKSSKGNIVNIAGLGGRMPEGEFAIGGSVNAALLNFTKALAEIGVRDGVRVNAINPGFIETSRLARSLDAAASRNKTTRDEAAAHLLERLGVSRFGKPQEVAALVAFMISPLAGYMNGTAIELDGGARRGI